MRWQSLSIDQNDRAKLRHGCNLHEGAVVCSEFHQSCPFFFTREGAQLNLIGTYRGGSAFLIAGGPSFAEIDKSKLRAVWTMTLNNAVTSYRSNANCTVDDPARFNYSMWLDPTIQKFVPMSHFEKPLWDNRLLGTNGSHEQRWQKAELKVGDCPNVIGYRRNEKFHAPRFLYEDTINWGCHKNYGGGRSVMLAALRILFLLGFRRVYLLGVDFEMSPEKKYHFTEQRHAGAIKGNMETYAKLEKWFAELQPHFLAEKFIVKNCNPKSKLTAFPFVSFEEAIQEATSSLGDYTRERTEGMYVDFGEKEKQVAAKSEQQLSVAKSISNQNRFRSAEPQIPKIAHFIWLGSEIPEMVSDNVESFRRCHRDWRIHVWTSLPKEIDPELINIINSLDLLCMRSDVLRTWLLHKYGGIYLDTDIYTLRSMEELRCYDHFVVACRAGGIANAAMGSRPGSNAMGMLLNKIREIHKKNINAEKRTRFGPKLLCEFNRRTTEQLNILPAHYFYVLYTQGTVLKFIEQDRKGKRPNFHSIRDRITDNVEPFALHSWGIPAELMPAGKGRSTWARA